MLIYAPQPDAEFAPIIGGLSAELFDLLESRLRSVMPAIRYLKEQEEGTHPAVPQFTLMLHREDRDRAMKVVHEAMARVPPHQFVLEREDRELAALVRQLTRAWQADDSFAVNLMRSYLCQNIQYLLGRLLLRAEIELAVDLWLDGIIAQDFKLVQPFELEIRGYIYVGAAKEPFEAELRASTRAPALERFSARFGDRSRLTLEAVIRRDVKESYPIDETAFRVFVGSTVRRKDGQLVDWAFEFVKE